MFLVPCYSVLINAASHTDAMLVNSGVFTHIAEMNWHYHHHHHCHLQLCCWPPDPGALLDIKPYGGTTQLNWLCLFFKHLKFTLYMTFILGLMPSINVKRSQVAPMTWSVQVQLLLSFSSFFFFFTWKVSTAPTKIVQTKTMSWKKLKEELDGSNTDVFLPCHYKRFLFAAHHEFCWFFSECWLPGPEYNLH